MTVCSSDTLAVYPSGTSKRLYWMKKEEQRSSLVSMSDTLMARSSSIATFTLVASIV